MTVPDYPPGEWSVLLVGAQWVSITSVTALNNAIGNRGTIQTNFSQLHDTLQNAITTTLAGQEGITADAIRDAFRQGADQAAKIAEKNGAYKKALQDALDSVQQLRDKLTAIANDGNKQINDDLDNRKTSSRLKVTKIAQIIADHQRQANQAAGDCAFSIIGAGQNVLDAQGTGQSFFGMARDAGIDANQQPDLKAIEDQVRGKLHQPALQAAPGPDCRWRSPAGSPGTRRRTSGPTQPCRRTAAARQHRAREQRRHQRRWQTSTPHRRRPQQRRRDPTPGADRRVPQPTPDRRAPQGRALRGPQAGLAAPPQMSRRHRCPPCRRRR